MERLSISSFVAHGHEYHLYGYGPIEGVPRGTVLRDANEILPEERVFVYRTEFGRGSFAAFSDLFRYKLLLERGGWWVDTDVVCLRQFDFTDQYVIGTERLTPSNDQLIVSSSVLKQPADSPLIHWVWSACQDVDLDNVQWGEIGPLLLQRGVDTLGLHAHLKPEPTFSPVPHFDCRAFVDSARINAIGPDVYAVHLWHQMWAHEGIDPEGHYAPSSFYEQLKQRFLGEGARVRL